MTNKWESYANGTSWWGARKRAKAIDFVPNVATWITGCRKEGGVPGFRNTYAGLPFDKKVLGVCVGGNHVESQWFKNVPPQDLELIRCLRGEWVHFAKKYNK